MKILADATLPKLAEAFPSPFELTLYHDAQELASLSKNQDVLLCRSTLKITEALLKHSSLSYVATASSGTDHVDANYLQTRGIQLIDAKGSNAPAVADYVLATLAFLSRYDGFCGKKAAVIGVGEVGKQVVARLKAIGMEIVCYDPPREKLDCHFVSCSLETVTSCDLIAIHANLHTNSPDPSFNLINHELLRQLKPNSVIINASRGSIVNENDLLGQTHPLIYCTDVFDNEPQVNAGIINFARLCTPHIAGHSIEAKQEAVTMISRKLHAAYDLTPPAFNSLASIELPLLNGQYDWQDVVLSLYNPLEETNLLKNATDLKEAFLNVRKAHHYRHDFCLYARSLQANSPLLPILGQQNQ